jgi:glycosyltransferase involved in cell wall biosynthesis
VSLERVSVAMATYNGLAHLDEQIRSLLGALAADDELVVVDDASTDGTWERLQRFGDVRMRLHRNPVNLGVRDSFQRALSLARFDVILLADQDDVWEVDKRDRLLETFVADPRVMVVVSDASLIDGDGRRLADSFMATRGGFDGSLAGTLVRSRFICSLCSTPNRCSSSTTTRPSRLKSIFFASSACVPMTTSIVPFASPSLVAFASLALPAAVAASLIHLVAAGPARRLRPAA